MSHLWALCQVRCVFQEYVVRLRSTRTICSSIGWMWVALCARRKNLTWRWGSLFQKRVGTIQIKLKNRSEGPYIGDSSLLWKCLQITMIWVWIDDLSEKWTILIIKKLCSWKTKKLDKLNKFIMKPAILLISLCLVLVSSRLGPLSVQTPQLKSV